MPRQRNTGKKSREEVAMEKLVGIWWGQRVGRTEWQRQPLLIHLCVSQVQERAGVFMQ